MGLKVYQYPKCGTCRKALKWLDENGVEYDSIHIVDNPPSQEELKSFIQKSELPAKSFLTRLGKSTES